MHKHLTALALAGLFAAATLPAHAAQTATAELKGPDGRPLGEATFTEAPKGVMVHLDVHGLPPGWHGLHFHEVGDCSKADFTSAGGHVHGQAAHIHGLLNPNGNGDGDLPNLYVAADGAGAAEFFTQQVALGAAGGRSRLLDADGSALVIHAKPDDYQTQPIGGAGPRIACGVIR